MLTDEELWALTPRMFFALKKRYDQQREHQELLAGIVASTIANHSLNPPNHPASPADYMPTQAAKKRAVPKQRINRKRIAQNVRNFLTAQLKVKG